MLTDNTMLAVLIIFRKEFESIMRELILQQRNIFPLNSSISKNMKAKKRHGNAKSKYMVGHV